MVKGFPKYNFFIYVYKNNDIFLLLHQATHNSLVVLALFWRSFFYFICTIHPQKDPK